MTKLLLVVALISLVVGGVVELRETLKWWESRPLWGKTAVVTRTRAQASRLTGLLEAAGGWARSLGLRRLLIEEGADIRKELYVGMVVDRGAQRVTLMASSEGGMDIEEVAAKTPEKIHKVQIDPVTNVSARKTAAISAGVRTRL